MEVVVIACYKPLPAKVEALKALMKYHWSRLNAEGLVSDRKPVLMQATDNTVIEVFGWRSQEAIDSAHSNPEVLKMWDEFAQVCEYVPIQHVPESQQLFSPFTPLF